MTLTQKNEEIKKEGDTKGTEPREKVGRENNTFQEVKVRGTRTSVPNIRIENLRLLPYAGKKRRLKGGNNAQRKK